MGLPKYQRCSGRSCVFRSYQPASGQIFGILKQMKEEFEANLSTEQKTEQQAASDFTELKKAKEYEINAAASQIKQKTQDSADAANKLAESKENLQGTREALVRRQMKNELNFPPNFEGLVFGCIDAGLRK